MHMKIGSNSSTVAITSMIFSGLLGFFCGTAPICGSPGFITGFCGCTGETNTAWGTTGSGRPQEVQNLAVSALCFPQLGRNIEALVCFALLVPQPQSDKHS